MTAFVERPHLLFERARRQDVQRVVRIARGRERIHVGWVKRLHNRATVHAGDVWRRFLAGEPVVVDRHEGALILDRSDPRGIWWVGTSPGETVGWVFLPRRPRGGWGDRGRPAPTREGAYERWLRRR